MGGPNTGGGTSTFGQGTSWVPLTLAALGGGLAGAGRQGSPASTMGTGLMTSMLGYYANQAATAEERARRRQLEDEALQRQKQIDAQQEQYRWADLALKSGQYDPSLTESPGAKPITFGANTMYLQKRPDFSIEPFVQMAEAAFPGSGETYRKSMEGVPPQQRSALAEPMFKAAQMLHGQTQTQNLSNTIGALARPRPNVTPEMELGMGSPPPMAPPSITGDQAALYQQAIQFPESRQQAFKQMQEHLAELTPGGGAQAPPPTPSPGMSRSTHWVQDPKTKRWSQQITESPENPQRALDTKETAFTVGEAERIEKSPGYKALYHAADSSGKDMLTSLINGAKQGIPADLQSLRNAMASTGTTAETFDKVRLEYLRKSGQLDQVLQNGVAATDPNRQDQRSLVNNLSRAVNVQEDDLSLMQPTHPQYAAKARRLAQDYRALADASPETWGPRAFKRMAELLGWDQATYMAQASEFASRHGIKIKGAK